MRDRCRLQSPTARTPICTHCQCNNRVILAFRFHHPAMRLNVYMCLHKGYNLIAGMLESKRQNYLVIAKLVHFSEYRQLCQRHCTHMCWSKQQLKMYANERLDALLIVIPKINNNSLNIRTTAKSYDPLF